MLEDELQSLLRGVGVPRRRLDLLSRGGSLDLRLVVLGQGPLL